MGGCWRGAQTLTEHLLHHYARHFTELCHLTFKNLQNSLISILQIRKLRHKGVIQTLPKVAQLSVIKLCLNPDFLGLEPISLP